MLGPTHVFSSELSCKLKVIGQGFAAAVKSKRLEVVVVTLEESEWQW